jgi:hypothetical protein
VTHREYGRRTETGPDLMCPVSWHLSGGLITSTWMDETRATYTYGIYGELYSYISVSGIRCVHMQTHSSICHCPFDSVQLVKVRRKKNKEKRKECIRWVRPSMSISVAENDVLQSLSTPFFQGWCFHSYVLHVPDVCWVRYNRCIQSLVIAHSRSKESEEDHMRKHYS